MNVQQPFGTNSHDEGETRADRQWRLLRGLSLATFVLIILLTLVGIPVYSSQMLAAPTAPAENAADPALPSILAEVGISAQTYAIYKVIVVAGNFPLVVVAAIIDASSTPRSIFEAVTGQLSQLAIVLSTLAIAAIFNPLRTRIQAIIDRRFYRKKYDAQQVLAHFAITARDETDMNALAAELARVVQETLEPAEVKVWLKGQRP